MSYFYSTTIPDVDRFAEKISRKKLGGHKTTNDYENEPSHATRQRRKETAHGRALSKVKISDNGDSNRNGKSSTSVETRHRRHRHPETEGITEELKEKDVLLSRVKSKCVKLEKNYHEAEEQCEKLKNLLDHRESEYKELRERHEDLTRLCESLELEKVNLSKIAERLNDENSQYKEDVSLLKILIYRLNVEIERYQDKLRSTKLDGEQIGTRNEDVDLTSENKRISESWGRVDLHALGPLLEAYQENLEEKEQLIRQYGNEINHFGSRCKEVVTENENLRTEIELVKSQYEKCRTEMKALREDDATIKEQNDLLTKQVSSQKHQIQEIHSLYEKKVESMSQDNNKLHADYLACTSELSNLRGKYEILSDGYEKMKKNTEGTMPVSVHTSTIEECKRLFEELRIQYDSEKKKLTDRVKRLEESNPENEKQLVVVTAERDQLKRQSKNLEKSLKRIQHKLEYFQRNLCSVQISRDSIKRQLDKVTKYCEDLLAEHEKCTAERDKLVALLNEREKENENIQYIGNNIAHRMGNLKSQLQSVQKGTKEQLESVEKHIKIQERGVGRLKTDYNRELQRLKNLVKQKEDVIGKLQREKYATRENLELVWKAATSDDKKLKDALKNTKICNI